MPFSFLIIMAVLLYVYTYICRIQTLFKEHKSSLKSLETDFSDEELLALVLAFHEEDRWLFSLQIIFVVHLFPFKF